MPDVVDDFEVPEEVMLRISERPENLDKVANRVQKYEFKKKFHDFREGKKLLVLDIDYTLFGKQYFISACLQSVTFNLCADSHNLTFPAAVQKLTAYLKLPPLKT